MQTEINDVIIIGGSYAGLSAALSLGRALRKVIIFDSDNRCNRSARHTQNFLTQDGAHPATIVLQAKAQVLRYPTVSFLNDKVVSVKKLAQKFEIKTESGAVKSARKILFATGLTDLLPALTGFKECWGISVLHCPYCHGYEFKNQPTGILEHGATTFGVAKLISQWTDNLTVFTNGKDLLNEEEAVILRNKNITIVEGSVSAIEHADGFIKNVVMVDQTRIPVNVIYAEPAHRQQCELPRELGCHVNEQQRYIADGMQRTNMAGVYVAGDNAASGRAVSVAIASGSIAGMYINKELVDDEFAKVANAINQNPF
jgi:thioredoxin reductase